MAFKFSKGSAVAIGTFNVYIIQPKWLAEVGLMETGSKVRMETDFRRPGLRFFAEGSPMIWHIAPDRIILETEDPTVDCGAKLAEVLDKLPWTPLVAVGMNSAFKGEPIDIERIPARRELSACVVPAEYEFAQRSLHAVLKREELVINTQVSDLITSAELSINCHTEVKDKNTQVETNLAAQQSCRKFFAVREEGLRLVKSLFDLELTI